MTSKKFKSIVILGGGTSGLISALILKKQFNDFNITIIKSDALGIIGVGEGSTEHWRLFMNFCNITNEELIKETDATLKYGILFENWTKHKYFHNITYEMADTKCGQYLSGFAYSIINNLTPKEYTTSGCFYNKISVEALPLQYHFNAFKLNAFLLKKCKLNNIKIIDDEIKKVNVKNNIINSIEGQKKKYKFDFYIDCSGFKKILISKLGTKWISYSKHLPMNEAIAFPTLDTDEYPPYTLSRAMSAGWLWRAPTNGRWGNGYVFNNRYIDAKQAQKECEDYLGYKIDIFKNIKFEAGTLDKSWEGNCAAIGLSSSFVEPLEASSLGTTINQIFLLTHLLPNYTKEDVDLYNKKFKKIVENIRDFIVMHYLVKKKDSKFWKELKLVLPETLKNNLNKWKHRLPIAEDFAGNYLLFSNLNITCLLKELNLYNKNYIKNQYNSLSKEFKDYTERNMKAAIQYYTTINAPHYISHKEYLQKIKNK